MTIQNTDKQKLIRMRKLRRRRLKRRVIRGFFLFIFSILFMVVLILNFHSGQRSNTTGKTNARYTADLFTHAPQASPFLPEGTPEELAELLKNNRETYDFVAEYLNRQTYLAQKIDLSTDNDVTAALAAGEVPLLMQWDLRWGYAPYGNDMLGLAGCGPTCLSMAYIALTGDTSMHPAAIAEFAYQNGFYTDAGTDWALWTDGAKLLGLAGNTLSLDESVMKNALNSGRLIICSMRPGDFTTTGHFILISGYDENGFRVKDPNRKSNSDRQWTFDELYRQIKNLWEIYQ